MTSAPAVGEPAPDFELPDHSGRPVRLSALRGRWVVLYFYPKDETPGCIAQACGFRDRFEEFAALGATVLGVSADAVDEHRAFVERRRLPFTLLSDTARRVIRAYGADLMGLLTRRRTFLIDPDGVVRARYESNLRAESHVEHALTLLSDAVGVGRGPSSSGASRADSAP